MKNLVKIIVTAPTTHGDIVRKAVGDVGAGKIGNYIYCSFTTMGIGRSMPQTGANPFIGTVGQIESIEEEKIEFVCERGLAKEAISAIRKVHPYDELALEIYPLIAEEEL